MFISTFLYYILSLINQTNGILMLPFNVIYLVPKSMFALYDLKNVCPKIFAEIQIHFGYNQPIQTLLLYLIKITIFCNYNL